MKRFKNILYILGADSEKEQKVADKARTLALLNEARITVVRVMEETLVEHFSKNFSERVREAVDLARKHEEEELGHFISHKMWHDINISSQLLNGRDFIVIIKKVLTDRHDLVIMAGSPEKEIDQLAMRLFRKCPCPVWVIAGFSSHEFRRILAAIDVSSEHEETRQLNRKIVELTYSLAQREQGEAHFVHAWGLEYEAMMRSPRFNMGDKEISSMKEELRQARYAAMLQLFQDVKIEVAPQKIHLLEGETSQVVERALQEFDIDVLVMGTVGRSGVPGLLIGNKAEKVLSQIRCTVLAVKPDGFLSPVNERPNPHFSSV